MSRSCSSARTNKLVWSNAAAVTATNMLLEPAEGNHQCLACGADLVRAHHAVAASAPVRHLCSQDVTEPRLVSAANK